METKPLKIIRLEASNIKRLKAVNIQPDGNVVVISGENDQGKSSVLDSILYALGGRDAICDVPIRAGASKAQIVCDLGDIVVERRFSASGGTSLTVVGKDKKTLPSPQSVLDKLCSKVAFDPLSFVKMNPKERAETLRKLVGLDFTKLEEQRMSAYGSRTMANRQLESAKIRLASVPEVKDAPETGVSVDSLMDQLTEAERINENNKKERNAAASIAENIKKCEDHILKLREQISSINLEIDGASKTIRERQKLLEMVEEQNKTLSDVDVSVIKTQITQAGEINEKIRRAKARKELADSVDSHQAESDKHTKAIEDIDKAKAKALADAKFPLPGLSFDDSGVVLNGIPFEQGSQAQQLKAAIAVGLALNPTVRVILIRDASLLDKKNMAVVAEMAKAADAQIWLEVVSSDDKSAIVIEDGNVKTVDEPKLL